MVQHYRSVTERICIFLSYLAPNGGLGVTLDVQLHDTIVHVTVALLRNANTPGVLVVESMVDGVDPGQLDSRSATDPNSGWDRIRVLLRDGVAGSVSLTNTNTTHESTELVNWSSICHRSIVVL